MEGRARLQFVPRKSECRATSTPRPTTSALTLAALALSPRLPFASAPSCALRACAPAMASANGSKKRKVAVSDDIEDLVLGEAVPPSRYDFAPGAAEAVRGRLLEWWDAGHRELPWRRERQAGETGAAGSVAGETAEAAAARAYAVWVSEVMLQQTQVERVKEYYNRWMARWPTIASLAAANLDEVREVWQGLGYYRRARFLLEGAQSIVSERGGVTPTDAAGWREVKGVGQYTAGAIASIAYDRAEPAVDGNVIRVLTRLRALGADPAEARASKLLWRLDAELVSGERPGDFNQAVMELGALVCTPLSPRCGQCPVSAHCAAHAADPSSVTRYPHKQKKAPPRPVQLHVAVVQRPDPASASSSAGRYLVVRRPEERPGGGSALLAGLWEFPSVEMPQEVAQEDEVKEEVKDEEENEPRLEGRGALEMAAAARATDISRRREAMRGLLSGLLGDAAADAAADGSTRLLAAADAPVVHTFSHLQHRMSVDWTRLLPDGFSDDAVSHGDGVRWVTAEEWGSLGASNGMKKVFEIVRAAQKLGGGAAGKAGKSAGKAAQARAERNKAGAAPEGRANERKISSYFGKK